MDSVTTVPRTLLADQVRTGDEVPVFIGTDLPCGSEKIVAKDDPSQIRWVRVNSIRRRGEGRVYAFVCDFGTELEFRSDESRTCPAPWPISRPEGVIRMQYSCTTGYAIAELCRFTRRPCRPHRPGLPGRRPTLLRPIRPARPNARRAAIAESLAVA